MVAGCLAGCAVDGKVRRDVVDLRRQIDSARRDAARDQTSIRELQDRLFLLEDKLETVEVGQGKKDDVPRLPVVQKRKVEETKKDGDDVQVVYEGEAARSSGKRPLLQLEGSGISDGPISARANPDEAPVREGKAIIHREETPPRDAERLPDPEAVTDRIIVTKRDIPVVNPPRGMRTSNPKPNEAAALYKSSTGLLKRGEHQKAIAKLSDFLERFPDHDYADNAQYWLAEAFYDLHDYDRAVDEFRKVVERYPTGNKVPDALLKLGFCYAKLGDKEAAKQVLSQIVGIYPKTASAKLAAERLDEWHE